MASYKQHCDECQETLDDPHGRVHKWLDEYFSVLGFGVKHRDVRHHEDGIREVREMWGDEAAEAAKIHIARDFNGWVPKDSLEVQLWRTSGCPDMSQQKVSES
jgi:hypothetical protein